MPRIVREAEIAWEGTTARGAGVVTAASSGAFELPVTIASRVGDPEGKTSPEELIAAAHASCFVTSLGSELARADTPPERLHVRCTITMDQIETGDHRIVASRPRRDRLCARRRRRELRSRGRGRRRRLPHLRAHPRERGGHG